MKKSTVPKIRIHQ